MKCHIWYLDATTVVFVLANLDLAIYEKEMMTRVALALYSTSRPDSYDLNLQTNATLRYDYEPLAEMEFPPCLSEFNGEESLFVGF